MKIKYIAVFLIVWNLSAESDLSSYYFQNSPSGETYMVNKPEPVSLVVPPIQSSNISNITRQLVRKKIYSELASLKIIEIVDDSIVEFEMFNVIDSSTTYKIWYENGMDHGKMCNGYNCSMETGRLTGARQVLIARLKDSSKGIQFDLKMVNTESGLVIRHESMKYTGTRPNFINQAIPDLIRRVSRVRLPGKSPTTRDVFITINKQKYEITKEASRWSSPWLWATGGSTLATGLAALYFWVNLPVSQPETVNMTEVVILE